MEDFQYNQIKRKDHLIKSFSSMSTNLPALPNESAIGDVGEVGPTMGKALKGLIIKGKFRKMKKACGSKLRKNKI